MSLKNVQQHKSLLCPQWDTAMGAAMDGRNCGASTQTEKNMAAHRDLQCFDNEATTTR